jgi:hypothetical protein
MYHPPKQVECCGGTPRISGRKAKGPDEGQQPSVSCVEQLLSRALTEVANGLFGYFILKMSIDATEGKLLICTCARVLEVIIGKSTIVAMVVKNLHAMLFGEVLKGLLGIGCLLPSEMSHQMNIL